jgi:hypothetical protein
MPFSGWCSYCKNTIVFNGVAVILLRILWIKYVIRYWTAFCWLFIYIYCILYIYIYINFWTWLMHPRWNMIKNLSSLSNSIPRSVQYYELNDCCSITCTFREHSEIWGDESCKFADYGMLLLARWWLKFYVGKWKPFPWADNAGLRLHRKFCRCLVGYKASPTT